MSEYYPIVAEFCENFLRDEDNSVDLSTQLLLPPNAKPHHFKLLSLDSDNCLAKVVAIVDEMMRAIMQKVPLMYIRRVCAPIRITIPSLDPRTTPQHRFLVDKDNSIMPRPPSHCSIYSALVRLTVAQIYGNSLAELIEKKADLTNGNACWQKLKTILANSSQFLERVLQNYRDEICNCPELNELVSIQREIDIAISDARFDDIIEVSENGICVSDFDLLTAALGLNGGVAAALCEIRKGSYNHQTDQYHIEDVVCRAVKENCNIFDQETDVIKILSASGFSNSKSSILAEKLQKDELSSLQPLAYWVEWYLNFMFEYDIFLTTEYKHFPQNEVALNEWFEIPATRDIYNESTDDIYESSFHVQVYNTVEGLESVTRDGVCYPPRMVEHGLWYHGTDHEAAEHIRMNGIQLQVGHEKQDFSDGYGFYLTPYISFAEQWALAKGDKNKGAIIAFRHSIDASKYNRLDLCLEEMDEKWSQVVKYYRSGKDSRLFKCPGRLYFELKRSDFIEGPMNGNNTFSCPAWEPVKKKGDCNQLCIKSQKLADEFSDSIDGIIFLSTTSSLN